MKQDLLDLAIEQTPRIISMITKMYIDKHPGSTITEAEVQDAFHLAIVKSIEIDDAWLAAHPRETTKLRDDL